VRKNWEMERASDTFHPPTTVVATPDPILAQSEPPPNPTHHCTNVNVPTSTRQALRRTLSISPHDFILESAGRMGINKIACCKLSNVYSQHKQHFRLLKLSLRFTLSNLTQRHWQVINSAAALKQQLRVVFRLRNDLYCVEWGVKLYSLTEGCLHCFLPYVGVTSANVCLRFLISPTGAALAFAERGKPLHRPLNLDINSSIPRNKLQKWTVDFF